MCSLLKQSFLVASLAVGLAAFQSVAAQSGSSGKLKMKAVSVGKLEMKAVENLRDFPAKRFPIKLTQLDIDPGKGPFPPCCPRCCKPNLLAKLKQWISRPEDMGIIIVPNQDLLLQVFFIEIYSSTYKLLFSTGAQCNGCGSGLEMQTKNKPAGYLLTLDKAAVAEAQKHYVEGNKINVVARVSKGSIEAAYFVDTREMLKK